jgi:hypothetical protein
MNQILNIVLVLKSGGDFHFSDVELLVLHLKRQLTKPFHVYCLTDIVKTETELADLTLLPFEHDWPIWWSKMNMFSPAMKKYRPFLYMDLDTCIINNIDALFPPYNIDHFITLENCYYPNRPGSGLMWIPTHSDKLDLVYSTWLKTCDTYIHLPINKYGDQNFIEDLITVDSYFTKDRIDTFKPKPTLRWRTEFPRHLSIVYFHGHPRPKVAAKTVKWVSNYVYYKEQDAELNDKSIKRAYVINLADREDRLKEFKKQEFPFQVERFPAIRLSIGIQGCNASHRVLLSDQTQFPFIVFEDDCKIINSWDIVEKAMQELPEDWDMLFVGANLNVPLRRYSEHLFHLQKAWTTHAVIYGNKKVVEFICENMPTDTTPIDVFYSNSVFQKFKCFVVSPIVAIQRAGHSNVVNGVRDYEQLMIDNFNKYTK